MDGGKSKKVRDFLIADHFLGLHFVMFTRAVQGCLLFLKSGRPHTLIDIKSMPYV